MRNRLTSLTCIALLPLSAIVAKPESTRQMLSADLDRPNIVLIVTDDQTYDSLQVMPWLSSQVDWTYFQNAFMPTPLCCPARTTLLTGQYSHHTGIMNNGTAQKFRDGATLATWLHAAGYQTGLIGKYLNEYPWNNGIAYIPPGWDTFDAYYSFDDNNGTAGYYGYTLDEHGTLVSYGSDPASYSTKVFTQRAVNFVNSATRPFFLYLTPHAPHQPYAAAPRDVGHYSTLTIPHGADFNERDVSDKPDWVQALRRMPAKEAKREDKWLRESYDSLLAVDREVQAVENAVEAQGQLDNTVILFMTDNGFSFGSHRLHNKRCEYESCIRTPLAIRYPGVAGHDEGALVSSIDIAPTIAEAAGVTPTIPPDGRSLVPLLNGTATDWRSEVFFEWSGDAILGNPFTAVRSDEWKYVELKTGERELYHLVNDPYEAQNIAGRPQYAAIQESLASDLAAFRAS